MDRYSSAKKASLFGIVGNLFLLIIKGIVGFMSSSQSMIADSVNSAGDILSSLMTFIGNKIASRPSDDDHNLGHGKAEYIYSMLISVVMILVAGKILIDSFFSFINKPVLLIAAPRRLAKAARPHCPVTDRYSFPVHFQKAQPLHPASHQPRHSYRNRADNRCVLKWLRPNYPAIGESTVPFPFRK